MNKVELVNAVAAKAELTKKDAEKAVSAVISSIEDALKAGEKVQLIGEPPEPDAIPRPVLPLRSLLPRFPLSKPALRSRTRLNKQRLPGVAIRLATLFLFRKGGFPMRLDKYLKVSRIIKRRTVANEVCDAKRVQVNGKVARASYDVKVGDVLEIQMGEHQLRAKVLAVNEHVTKADASAMYEIIP